MDWVAPPDITETTLMASHFVSDAGWKRQSVKFTATRTWHRLRFDNTGVWDGMVHIDDVSVEEAVFFASWEDGEINPGGADTIATLNTTPYPATQPETLSDGEYGWALKDALGTVSGTIVDTAASAGSNSAKIINGRYRTSIPFTMLPNQTYTFSLDYSPVTSDGTILVELKLTAQQGATSTDLAVYTNLFEPATAGTWYTKSVSFNSANFPSLIGQAIELRVVGRFTGVSGEGAYTDNWRVTRNAYFADVSGATGITALYVPDANDNAVAWGDYDNDGYIDMYLGTYEATKGVYLFKNNGGTNFTQPFTAASGNFAMWWPGVFVDYDNDGDLDIYSAMNGGRLVSNDGASFTNQTPLLETFTWQSECAAWADLNKDGFLDFYRSGWEAADTGPYYPDAIFMQSGGNFNISWWQSTEADRKAGRGVTMADFDEDGDIDIYVSNYRISKNFLWLNDGAGNFTDVAAAYGVAADGDECSPTYPGGHTIGSAWGDLDNDGHLDLVVGNFAHPGYSCQDKPKFYRNLGPAGNWHFQQMFELDGDFYTQSHASPALADFDNDGDLDVFITAVSGYYAGETSSLIRNDGNWSFTEVSSMYGLEIATPQTNFQAAWGDYDNDGDLDLFTGRKLYKNSSAGSSHWLEVALESDNVSVNSNAIGAQVRVTVGGQIITRQAETATGWGNQNDPRLHFGLGAQTAPVTLEVFWPNGAMQIFPNVAVDQRVVISYSTDDIYVDGRVDFKDYALFAGQWLETGCTRGCGGADLVFDGDVDIDDLREFATRWLE
jgi:hypothetical protein